MRRCIAASSRWLYRRNPLFLLFEIVFFWRCNVRAALHGPVGVPGGKLVEPEQPTNLIDHPIHRGMRVVAATAGVARVSSHLASVALFSSLLGDSWHCFLQTSVCCLEPV